MKLLDTLHEYDFPYHDYLLDHLDHIDQVYSEGKEANLSIERANVPYPHEEVWEFLNPKLNKIVQDNYYVSPYCDPNSFGIYRQDGNQDEVYDAHNHVNSSTIIGVFYINPPKPGEGGELVLHFHNNYNTVYYLQPKPNKLYLFPSWVYHHVNPQRTLTPRYSINWGYNSRLRPIHKITGDLW